MSEFSLEKRDLHERFNQKLRARGDVSIIMKVDRLMDKPMKDRNLAIAAITVEVKLIPKA